MSLTIDEVLKELDKIPNSKTIENAEKLYRELSYMSADDLFKQFTI